VGENSALLAVIDFMRPNLFRNPSLDYLAFSAGLSEDEFRTSLNRLCDNGLLTVLNPDEFEEEDDDGLKIDHSGIIQRILEITSPPKPKAPNDASKTDQHSF
jgi:hypothetical protein